MGKEEDYQLKREIGIKILEQLDEWTDEFGFETSMDMEMELCQRIQGILTDKGFIK